MAKSNSPRSGLPLIVLSKIRRKFCSRKALLATIKHVNPHDWRCLLRFRRGEKSKPMRKRLLWLRLAVFIRKASQLTVSGNVPNSNWNRDNRQANLDRNDPRNRNDNYGVRGRVRIYAFRDFIQPPSILPISASLLCVWKILVSLAIAISKKRRNFKTEISKWLCALIR